tara:strand:- start:3983 stop:4117 length:135 start_codon:yes stop_codon:yes gene_type:complete
MMKNFLIFLFVAILFSSCGKKGDPIYNEQNQSSLKTKVQIIFFL